MKHLLQSSGRHSPVNLKNASFKTTRGLVGDLEQSFLESVSLEIRTDELGVVIGEAMLTILVSYDAIEDMQIVNSSTLFVQTFKEPTYEINDSCASKTEIQKLLLDFLKASPWPGYFEIGVKMKKLKAFQRVARSVPELSYKGMPRVVFLSNSTTPESTLSGDGTSVDSESPTLQLETVDDWLSSLTSPELCGPRTQNVQMSVTTKAVLSPPRSVEIADILAVNPTISASPMRPSRLEFVDGAKNVIATNSSNQILPIQLFEYCVGLLKNGSCDAALECVVAHPEIASQSDENGEYLLHHATLSPGSSLELVAAIYNTYPDAVAKRSNSYRFPLHCAAANSSSSSEIIFMLYKMYPYAAGAKTKTGKTPLHTGAAFSGSPDAIKALCILYPQSAKIKDKSGSYPLHLIAAHSKVTRKLLEIIVDLYPSAATEKDGDGNLPFHIATGNLLSVDLISVILDANPSAIKEVGSHGRYGIHFAAANTNASFEVVKFLGEKWPESVKKEDEYGFIPMQIVLKGCCAYDFVDYLLSKDFPITEDGAQDPSHSESWALLMEPTSEDGLLIAKSIIQVYLDKFKTHAKSLIYILDRYGRSCFSIAHFEIRQIFSEYTLFLDLFEMIAVVHRSENSLIYVAKRINSNSDISDKNEVALKFTKKENLFVREIVSRSSSQFRGALPILWSFDSSSSEELAKEFETHGFVGFPYLVIIPVCEQSLEDMLRHDYLVGNHERLPSVIRDVCVCLSSLHSVDVVHCQLRPSHVMKAAEGFTLIDLASSRSIGDPYVHTNTLTVYDSPEIAAISVCTTKELAVSTSMDMWSLGALLYFLFTGMSLWNSEMHGKIVDHNDILKLMDWDTEVKSLKLAYIDDDLARDLVGSLLRRDPSARADVVSVLSHPYLCRSSISQILLNSTEQYTIHVSQSPHFNDNRSIHDESFSGVDNDDALGTDEIMKLSSLSNEGPKRISNFDSRVYLVSIIGAVSAIFGVVFFVRARYNVSR